MIEPIPLSKRFYFEERRHACISFHSALYFFKSHDA